MLLHHDIGKFLCQFGLQEASRQSHANLFLHDGEF